MHFLCAAACRYLRLFPCSRFLSFSSAARIIMISVLAQERLLGAALGSLVSGLLIFEQRINIYESIKISDPQPREPIFGRKSRQGFAKAWNKAVDETFGPVIESLSSRGW